MEKFKKGDEVAQLGENGHLQGEVIDELDGVLLVHVSIHRDRKVSRVELWREVDAVRLTNEDFY